MAYQTGNIAGTFHQPDGTPPPSGHAYLSFAGITPALVKDSAGDVVLSGTLHTELVDGTFTFAGLPATDDTSLNPTGFGYQIQVRIPGWETITVTTALPAGSTVQVEDLLGAAAAAFDPHVTYLTSADPIDGGTP